MAVATNIYMSRKRVCVVGVEMCTNDVGIQYKEHRGEDQGRRLGADYYL